MKNIHLSTITTGTILLAHNLNAKKHAQYHPIAHEHQCSLTHTLLLVAELTWDQISNTEVACFSFI